MARVPGTTVEKKGATKRQHYVPQMILRNFSKSNVSTSLIVLSSGKRVPEAPINRQCYADYFYGEDQIMEQSFSREEAKISRILGDLSRSRFEGLSDDDIQTLKFFVHYQRARTRGAAESHSNFAEAFAKSVLRGTAELNNNWELHEAIEHVRIRFEGVQSESIWNAAKSTPLLYDLDVRFITTSRKQGFVIGDHPVVAYNQFAEHHTILSRCPTSTGIALKGLQLFMPLSPDVTLALFDPSTYEFDGKRVCGAGPRDVRFLNEMQAVNAWSCVFFDPNRVDDTSIERLLATRNGHPSLFEKSIATSEMLKRNDGTFSQFVVVMHPDVRVGARLSFVRTTDKHPYVDTEVPTIPVRSPALVAFAERYGELLEREVARGRAANGNAEPPSQSPAVM